MDTDPDRRPGDVSSAVCAIKEKTGGIKGWEKYLVTRNLTQMGNRF